MHKVLSLYKSHFSLGKSILSLESPSGKITYPVSIFDILIQNKLNTLTLVEDNISGLLQASKNAAENNIKLIFGLRMTFTEDCLNQNEESRKKRAKYIIFTKNSAAYKDILKIWSFAAKEGFYYNPAIDFQNLKKLWTNNLLLAVPFYDSYLYLNIFYSHQHVPDFSFTKPVFLLENHNLPFDEALSKRVAEHSLKLGFETLNTHSIYYYKSEDFLAYLAFRCIHNRSFSSKATLERPELDHMSSNDFSFEAWLKKEQTND